MDVGRLREHARVLGFTPQDEVRWLAPGELLRTAIKVALSSLFADYLDRREVQAALPATTLRLAPDADGGLWLDHVADLGDGFDSTYTVARMVAADGVEVDPPPQGGAAVRLPRARLLVLGGDEVYPTPSSTGYEDRMRGPYRAALPPGAADPAPLLLALPGNHDWYDGLTAFLRLFAQRRPLGGWRTVQTRSYFIAQLPHRWWLVALDTQLGTYIDDPQIRYFREHLSSVLEPGDAVIVATPSPTWVHTGQGDPDAFNALHYFEREVVELHRDLAGGTVRPTGATVRLWITGDLHHYARYAERVPPDAGEGAARQFVTCGLGGAYLLDTHRLPDELDLPSPQSRMTQKSAPARFELHSPWPTKEESRRLVAGLFAGPPRGLPFRNPGFWRLVGGVHGALLLVLLFALGLEMGWNLTGVLRLGKVGDVAWFGGQALVWFAGLYLLLVLRPLTHLSRPRAPSRASSEVFWAGLAQILVALAGMAVLVAVPWPPGWPDWIVLGLALLATIVVTGLAGSYVFAGYVAVSRLPTVQGWQLSAQAIEDVKGFVRLRIDPDGRLTLYPIVVDEVCHDWALGPDGLDGAPGSVRPEFVGAPPRPHLVEPPIVIDRRPPTAPSPGQAEPASQPATTS
ncbi:MAG: metallophosphoesterase [Kineosporiaceae bacterium]